MRACENCCRLRICCERNIPGRSCSACIRRKRPCRESSGAIRARESQQQQQQQRERWTSVSQAMLQRLTRMRDGLQAIENVQRFQQNSQTLQVQAESLRISIERFAFDQALSAVPRGRVRLGYRAEPHRIQQILLHSFANLQRRYELLVELVSRNPPTQFLGRSLRIAR